MFFAECTPLAFLSLIGPLSLLILIIILIKELFLSLIKTYEFFSVPGK